jgi:hypothetical protein
MTDRPTVLASLLGRCQICHGRPMRLHTLDGRVLDLPRCPHCGYRHGVPYLSLPSYQDRKIDD